MCFVAHNHKEDTAVSMRQRQDNGGTASKVNGYEIRMVIKTVWYLLSQGHQPDQVITFPASPVWVVEESAPWFDRRAYGDRCIVHLVVFFHYCLIQRACVRPYASFAANSHREMELYMLNASAVQDRGRSRGVPVLSSARWSYVVVGWQPQVVRSNGLSVDASCPSALYRCSKLYLVERITPEQNRQKRFLLHTPVR